VLGFPFFWVSGFWGLCVFGFPDFWVSGFLGSWVEGCLEAVGVQAVQGLLGGSVGLYIITPPSPAPDGFSVAYCLEFWVPWTRCAAVEAASYMCFSGYAYGSVESIHETPSLASDH
jgi:hypothetical protein